MSIRFDSETRVFSLETAHTSYHMKVDSLGHMPHLPADEDRFTLDELLYELRTQAGKWIHQEDIAPSSCDHPLCGFHGDFVVMPDRTLMPLTRRGSSQGECCCGVNTVNPAEKNREFVGRRWERRDAAPASQGDSCCSTSAPKSGSSCCSGSSMSMEDFLDRAKSHGFTITAMAFQDAGNLDIERLRQCSLHVYKDGRMVPFCSYYLTPFGE